MKPPCGGGPERLGGELGACALVERRIYALKALHCLCDIPNWAVLFEPSAVSQMFSCNCDRVTAAVGRPEAFD